MHADDLLDADTAAAYSNRKGHSSSYRLKGKKQKNTTPRADPLSSPPYTLISTLSVLLTRL